MLESFLAVPTSNVWPFNSILSFVYQPSIFHGINDIFNNQHRASAYNVIIRARLISPTTTPTRTVCAVVVGIPNEVGEGLAVGLAVAFVQDTLEAMWKLLSNVRSAHCNHTRKLEICLSIIIVITYLIQ